MSDEKIYAIKKNKEIVPISNSSFGSVLPSDDEGEEGDVFFLLIEEE